MGTMTDSVQTISQTRAEIREMLDLCDAGDYELADEQWQMIDADWKDGRIDPSMKDELKAARLEARRQWRANSL